MSFWSLSSMLQLWLAAAVATGGVFLFVLLPATLPSAPPLIVLLFEDRTLLLVVLSSGVENKGELMRGCWRLRPNGDWWLDVIVVFDTEEIRADVYCWLAAIRGPTDQLRSQPRSSLWLLSRKFREIPFHYNDDDVSSVLHEKLPKLNSAWQKKNGGRAVCFEMCIFDLLFGANCWHLQQKSRCWRWH